MKLSQIVKESIYPTYSGGLSDQSPLHIYLDLDGVLLDISGISSGGKAALQEKSGGATWTYISQTLQVTSSEFSKAVRLSNNTNLDITYDFKRFDPLVEKFIENEICKTVSTSEDDQIERLYALIYAGLPKNKGGQAIANAAFDLASKAAGSTVQILTSLPKGIKGNLATYLTDLKKLWVKDNYPNYKFTEVIVVNQGEKAEVVKNRKSGRLNSNDILIDDSASNVEAWIENSGTAILHYPGDTSGTVEGIKNPGPISVDLDMKKTVGMSTAFGKRGAKNTKAQLKNFVTNIDVRDQLDEIDHAIDYLSEIASLYSSNLDIIDMKTGDISRKQNKLGIVSSYQANNKEDKYLIKLLKNNYQAVSTAAANSQNKLGIPQWLDVITDFITYYYKKNFSSNLPEVYCYPASSSALLKDYNNLLIKKLGINREMVIEWVKTTDPTRIIINPKGKREFANSQNSQGIRINPKYLLNGQKTTDEWQPENVEIWWRSEINDWVAGIKQTKNLNHFLRRGNILNGFIPTVAVIGEIDERDLMSMVDGKHSIIVDDLVTFGMTLQNLAGPLVEAGSFVTGNVIWKLST